MLRIASISNVFMPAACNSRIAIAIKTKDISVPIIQSAAFHIEGLVTGAMAIQAFSLSCAGCHAAPVVNAAEFFFAAWNSGQID
jgi:hypothetical protein